MGVTAEALVELAQLLVDHRVLRDEPLERGLLLGIGQLAVQEQVADLEKLGLGPDLLDRVAAVEQDALLAIDEGERRFAGSGRLVARVEGGAPGLAVEPLHVDDGRAGGALADLQLDGQPRLLLDEIGGTAFAGGGCAHVGLRR